MADPKLSDEAALALRETFMRWQCRLRQIAVRNQQGQPTSGMAPIVYGSDGRQLMQVVTVLCRTDDYSATMEFQHMYRRTLDPASRREDALNYLSERYYQQHTAFSDLTASFAPDSSNSKVLLAAEFVTLSFEQFSQKFELICKPQLLAIESTVRAATYWHNALFNPLLPADCDVIAFVPDWARSAAKPVVGATTVSSVRS
jgi:hypothetical protein